MNKNVIEKLSELIKSIEDFSKEHNRGDFPLRDRILEELSEDEILEDIIDCIFDEYAVWYDYMLIEAKELQNLLDCNNEDEEHLYNRLEWFEDDFLEHEHVLQFEDLIDFIEFALNNLLNELD